MATRSDIVVLLDGRLVDPDEPILGVADPMVSRGDGVFETVLVRDGRPRLLHEHLDRLARSAALVGLPEPEPSRWLAAAMQASSRWPHPGDAVVRLVYGRGRDGPTGFVTVSVLPERALVARRQGVSALTLDRGVPARGSAVAPSIAGAKSLSYAVNAAALREADRRGAGDVVLVSSDGFVLEGPRSSVVMADGAGTLVTPPATLPILPGVTVRAVFDVARAHGIACEERLFGVADLIAAQGVWLLSSITLAARVHALDGVALPAAPTAVDMARFVDEAMASPP